MENVNRTYKKLRTAMRSRGWERCTPGSHDGGEHDTRTAREWSRESHQRGDPFPGVAAYHTLWEMGCRWICRQRLQILSQDVPVPPSPNAPKRAPDHPACPLDDPRQRFSLSSLRAWADLKHSMPSSCFRCQLMGPMFGSAG